MQRKQSSYISSRYIKKFNIVKKCTKFHARTLVMDTLNLMYLRNLKIHWISRYFQRRKLSSEKKFNIDWPSKKDSTARRE